MSLICRLFSVRHSCLFFSVLHVAFCADFLIVASLFAAMYAYFRRGRRLCEDIHAVLAHVLDQLADGPLTAGDQLLQRRAETLQARLESIV